MPGNICHSCNKCNNNININKMNGYYFFMIKSYGKPYTYVKKLYMLHSTPPRLQQYLYLYTGANRLKHSQVEMF